MSARLVFKNAGRRFRSGRETVVALSGIDLTLENGSFTAVVGPSGCGKSTLMHIAAGIDTQFDGEFAYEPSSARFACLFQQPRLLPWHTAHSNVSFILESTGTPRRDAARQATEILHLVGLGDALDRYPSQLSGGMQQRVALARALSVDPDVLLMDEPFSALDELTAARLREELIALCALKARTILFVTHNINEACYLADRVVVMAPRPGRIVADIAIDIPRPRRLQDPRLSQYVGEILGHIQSGSETTAQELSPA